jgi:hypothetical protein
MRQDRPSLPKIDGHRYCINCGARISLYNPDETCSSCTNLITMQQFERAAPKRAAGTTEAKSLIWRRSFNLIPSCGPCPVSSSSSVSPEELARFVAHECGVALECVRSHERGGSYTDQAARVIYLYLGHVDLCGGGPYKDTALFLQVDEQRVRNACLRMEHNAAHTKVAAAVGRIRTHYQSVAQAAA